MKRSLAAVLLVMCAMLVGCSGEKEPDPSTIPIIPPGSKRVAPSSGAPAGESAPGATAPK